MKKLVQSAVARPVGVTIMCIALAVVGLVSLRQLAIDLLPAVDVPWISITTAYEGVAPQEIETLVTRPIEQATSTVQDVRRIEATSSEGLSRVQLQFDWGTNVEVALDDIRVALDRVRAQLPEDAETPAVYKFDLASTPMMTLSVSGQSDPREMKFLAEDALSRALERIVGVASVSARGGRDREIRVELDAEKLSSFGLNAAQIESALASENRTVSAGDMESQGRNVVLRTAGEFDSLDDIRNTVVANTEDRVITVSEVALVTDTIREIRSDLWIDGVPGIELRLYKQSGANTVAVSERVHDAIARINEDYDGRVRLAVLWDSADYIRAAVEGVQASALLGGALAILILLIFLRSVRATLVVSAAIPLSVIGTFAVLFWQEMTLNVISFGGLALAIGILVDAAVVILESIYRRHEETGSARLAAVEGAGEVASAVVAGTLTTLAVFAPIVFVGGFSGVLFGELALVVTFALACSLLVALTLVPMLAGKLLARGRRVPSGHTGKMVRRLDSAFALFENAYGRLIESSLGRPWAVVFGAVSILLASGLLALQIPAELIPQADEGRVDADFEFPVGTPIEQTRALMQKAEELVTSYGVHSDELDHVVTSAGPEAWWRPGGSHEGEVELMLTPGTQRSRDVTQIASDVRKSLRDIPGVQLRVRTRSSNILTRIIQRGEDRLSVEILGHDLETADRLATQVASLMREVPGVTDARPDREMGQLERVLQVDRKRAAQFGLGGADVAEAVERYVAGRVATFYRDQGDEFDIRVVLRDSQRHALDQLENLPIVTATGATIPLGSLVTLQQRIAPSSIARVDQERILRVTGGITSERSLQDIATDIENRLQDLSIPPGFSVGVGGEAEELDDTFLDMLVGILLSLFLVFAVMAVQFESARQPLIIMASVPFAFVGVILMLLLSRTTFNVYSFLGSIVLVGIVVNNAIVLVDTTNLLRRRDHLPIMEALTRAGVRRLRPILMTTLTTLLGLVPLALGMGEGSEMQTPLARAIIGGLTTSTLVTLVLVPAIYLISERSQPVPGTVEFEDGST